MTVTGAVVTPTRPFLVDAITPILEALEAGGIRVTLDVKDLNPPGCYLAPPEIEFRFRAGDFTATHTLLLVVRNTTRRLAMAEMSGLLVAVQTILGERVQRARAVDVPTNDGTAVLLGYEFSWHERVRQVVQP
jgi:hypothetical protein